MSQFFKRLFCCHYWERVNVSSYGQHSCWDIVTRTPRLWQCRDCQKTTVLRDMPVNQEFKPARTNEGETK